MSAAQTPAEGAPAPASLSPVPLASPCTNVCTMDSRTGWCAGCWRTLDEIAGWSAYDEAEKRATWARLQARRNRVQAAP